MLYHKMFEALHGALLVHAWLHVGRHLGINCRVYSLNEMKTFVIQVTQIDCLEQCIVIIAAACRMSGLGAVHSSIRFFCLYDYHFVFVEFV